MGARCSGDEQVEGLRLAHLADHETVGAHPQRLFDEAPQRDLARALETRLPALHRDTVARRQVELEGLLYSDDALARPGRGEQRVEHRGLAALGRPGDQDVLPAEHAHAQELGRLVRARAESDEPLQIADPLGELADVDRPEALGDVRDDDMLCYSLTAGSQTGVICTRSRHTPAPMREGGTMTTRAIISRSAFRFSRAVIFSQWRLRSTDSRRTSKTQAEVAEAAGMSQSQLSKYLRAVRTLTADELDDLCTALELRLIDVVTRADALRNR